MQVFRGLAELPRFQNPVVTIGSYDGVHHGHRTIIERMRQVAREINGESIILTFHPHPRQVVFPNDKSLRLLNTLDEKIELLSETGLDHLVILPFTVEFSQINPYDYVDKILIEGLQVKHLIVGYDHRFGLNREGNYDLLDVYAKQGLFTLEQIEEQDIEDLHVSSSAIRNHIKNGLMTKANKLLQKSYMLSGQVIHGDKIARGLGFPTANCQIDLSLKVIPAPGTYAAEAQVDHKRYRGMLYIGKSKTLHARKDESIEINLFEDPDESLYGKKIKIFPLKHIRQDQELADREELLYHIHADKTDCELYFSQRDSEIKLITAILNYNGAKHITQYLPSHLPEIDDQHAVVVIDNGSSDNSIDVTSSISDEVDIIKLPENLGFAGGYTTALSHVNSTYVAIVNSDVQVTAGWLNPIIELLDSDDSIAAVQPKIRSHEDPTRFEYAGAAGGYLDALGYPYCRGRIMSHVEVDNGQYDTLVDVDWVSGAAMVIRLDAFRQCGGFDPDFFAHMEEIDLCWRLRSAGYRLVCEPKSVVHHLGGGTLSYQSSGKAFLNLRNSYWMLLKNESQLRLIWLLPVRLLFDHLYGFTRLMSGRPGEAFGVLRGIWVGFSKVMTVSAKRRKRIRYQRRYGLKSKHEHRATAIWLPWSRLMGKSTYTDIVKKGNP
ncbi:MAG: riboflavin biosynthesis protein RibF [Bacteroidota bacterium]